MKSSLRPYVLACLLGLMFWLSQKLIYESFIVPHLQAWSAIPIAWWVAVLAPEIAICALAAWIFRQIKEAILFCVLGGFVITACQFLAGLLNEPGHLKAIEGGMLQFGMQFLVVTLLLFGAIGMLSLIRLGVGHVRAG